MIDEEKLAIARSYEQMEHTLAFVDFQKWVSEEAEAAERSALVLGPADKHLFEPAFLKWQAWKSVQAAIEHHLVLAKEVIKESKYVGEPDSPELIPVESNPYLPGYGI